MNLINVLYGVSKHAVVALSESLRLELLYRNARVNVSVLCPGPVNSNIAREIPALFKPLLKMVFNIFFRSPEKASDPVIFQACSRDQEGRTNDYLFLMNRKEMDPKSTDPENGRRLWELSEKLASQLN